MEYTECFSIMNNYERIIEANARLENFCKKYGLQGNLGSIFSIVLDEILNNIMTYSYNDSKEHIIDIKFIIEDDIFTLIFCDDGQPFDPGTVPVPALDEPIDERKAGGLGIHIVRKLMDEVDHRREEGKNYFIVKKRL